MYHFDICNNFNNFDTLVYLIESVLRHDVAYFYAITFQK